MLANNHQCNPTAALQVKSVDGVDAVFQPISLPTDTVVSILPVEPDDLACSLTNPKTRFKPFGYKEIVSDPPQDTLEDPARVYWRIPERFKSLEKIKFLTLSSPSESPLSRGSVTR